MMENLERIRSSSRRAGFLTIAGFLVVVASLLYSYTQLSWLERAIEEKKDELASTKVEIGKLREDAKKIRQKVNDLDSTQQSLLDFLVSVTDRDKVSILGSNVDWDEVKQQLNHLPSGQRKNAILNAMLLAWKDIPFSMGQENVRVGFDSPRFLRYVLKTVGLNVKSRPGEPLSVTLMKRFEKVDDPKPGDLVFFKGQVGSFGFILASVGKDDSEHVGIGTLQKIAPLQVISMGNINTPFFPLRGYFRVVYPDEE